MAEFLSVSHKGRMRRELKLAVALASLLLLLFLAAFVVVSGLLLYFYFSLLFYLIEKKNNVCYILCLCIYVFFSIIF